MDDKDNDSINKILDKLILLKEKEKKGAFPEKALCVFGIIAGIILLVFLCVMMYKNNFSIESLLSLLLAFFSIFISIFFYFKASDTSNKFYDNSYNFMKDISVTLGKIEERFGEKLNSLNDKISHITDEKSEKTEELKMAEDEKQAIIDDLLEKSNLEEEEKKEYIRRLQDKEEEADSLRRQLRKLDAERRQLRQYSNEITNGSNNNGFFDLINQLSEDELMMLYHGKSGALSNQIRMKMKRLGINTEDFENDDSFRFMIRKALENKR